MASKNGIKTKNFLRNYNIRQNEAHRNTVGLAWCTRTGELSEIVLVQIFSKISFYFSFLFFDLGKLSAILWSRFRVGNDGRGMWWMWQQ